jgi:hypothetical protein
MHHQEPGKKRHQEKSKARMMISWKRRGGGPRGLFVRAKECGKGVKRNENERESTVGTTE